MLASLGWSESIVQQPGYSAKSAAPLRQEDVKFLLPADYGPLGRLRRSPNSPDVTIVFRDSELRVACTSDLATMRHAFARTPWSPALRALRLGFGYSLRGDPQLVELAHESCGPVDRWILHAHPGDDLKRLHFLIFSNSDTPTAVIKFSRVPGNRAPFDAEARHLRMFQDWSEVVQRPVPKLLSTGETNENIRYNIETAVGSPGFGGAVLAGEAERISDVVAWLGDLAEETVEERATGGDQLRELFSSADLPLPRGFESIPAVFCHNDLGTWNLTLSGTGFGVVDWEGADRHGFPLWDLAYFLLDVLTLPNDDVSKRVERGLAILAGEVEQSIDFWRPVGAYAERMNLPERIIRPLLTACLIFHSKSAASRSTRASALGGQASPVRFLHGSLFTALENDDRFGQAWGLG